MPPVQAPLIDPRSYGDLVAELETLAQQYTAGEIAPSAVALTGAVLDQTVVDGAEVVATAGTLVTPALAARISGIAGLTTVKVRGWQPPAPQAPLDAGAALIRVFSRLAELAIDRINQLPQRNYLAFLDLIGTRPSSPQPARVPLTFHLAAGSQSDALVPARTQVAAAPLETDTAPVLFETERPLVVTRSQLAAAWVREPERDLYRDSTAVLTGQESGAVPVFRGEKPVRHVLYLGQERLLGMPETKSLVIQIVTAQHSHPWLHEVAWDYWDGTGWAALSLPVVTSGYVHTLSHPNMPYVPPSEIAGVTSSYLRARLIGALPPGDEQTSAAGYRELRRAGLQARDAYSFDPNVGGAVVDATRPFYPFGDSSLLRMFQFAFSRVDLRPGGMAEIEILLDESLLPEPSSNWSLTWEYQDHTTWKPLPGVVFTPYPTSSGNPAQPFLVSGKIRFPIPGPWYPAGGDPAAALRWLRAVIATGGFGSGPAFHPPRVERLTLASTWELPLITDLRINVHINRLGAQHQVAPDAGVANQAAVDLTKDFLPFGEKPKIGDAFYFSSEPVFSKYNAEVDLAVTLTNTNPDVQPWPPRASENLILAWEFWDGAEWQLLGHSGPGADELPPPQANYQFADATNGFQEEGNVHFRVPFLKRAEVLGEPRLWIRVRIAAGDYGKDATYVPTGASRDGVPVYRLEPATFRPPSIRSLRLGYLFTDDSAYWYPVLTENDFRFSGDQLQDGMFYSFEPFQPTADRVPTLYLGFDRPGDATGFANRSVTLYFGVAGALYDPATEHRGTLEDAVVVWEYWNGQRWQRLGTRDETRGFTRRGLVTFIGPPDFVASTEFGRSAFWLRARWERGSYAVEPELARVLTNTMWAVHARTFLDETLGSSRAEQSQSFRTAQGPVLAGQVLEVIEPEVPSGLDRAELEAETGGAGEDAVRLVLDDAGRPAEVRVRWHEVQDFYTSGPRSRHYTLDRLTGEVRFGDGRRGLIPPLGRNNVRISYRAGGGLAGNRPAGNITQLRGTVPYVDSVFQYEPAQGGSAEESLADVAARGPRRLRHRDRAVAPTDFEDLALEATTEVARARCLPARDGTTAGQVGLIVVPRSTSAKPVPTIELLARVRGFLEPRVSPTLDLWVVGPDWLEVVVEAEVVPMVMEAATDVQNAVLERLAAFLHPLTGGLEGTGWAFGRKPYRSDLYALIEATPGIDHVRRLEVTETPREGGARPERFLVYSGDHQITVSSNTDESAPDQSLGSHGSLG